MDRVLLLALKARPWGTQHNLGPLLLVYSSGGSYALGKDQG